MVEAEPEGLAAGTVLGAFGYTSTGNVGWSVTGTRNRGGLTPDAVDEARALIERVPWWSDPGQSVQGGRQDVLERPRRLAWLGGWNTPRRFLVHTIHAERDASGRPGNNYSECLVVSRGRPQDPVPGAEPLRWRRPSQLWDASLWCTPWGAQEVAEARPGTSWLKPATPTSIVFGHIAGDPVWLAQLRALLRAVHDVLHHDRPPIVVVVDDFIPAAGTLDCVLALLPQEDIWDATFDIRSVAPIGRLGTDLPARVNLFGPEYKGLRPQGTLDLTYEAVRAQEPIPQLSNSLSCPTCERWLSSVDSLLSQSPPPGWEEIESRLESLQQPHRRRLEVQESQRMAAQFAQGAPGAPMIPTPVVSPSIQPGGQGGYPGGHQGYSTAMGRGSMSGAQPTERGSDVPFSSHHGPGPVPTQPPVQPPAAQWEWTSAGADGRLSQSEDLAAIQWVGELLRERYLQLLDGHESPAVQFAVLKKLWMDVAQMAAQEVSKYEAALNQNRRKATTTKAAHPRDLRPSGRKRS